MYLKPSRSLYYGDLHLHTNLSFCAPDTTVPLSYLPHLENEDVRVLGFSNHLYPKLFFDVFGVDESDGVARSMRILPQLEELREQTGAKILLGAEVEVIKGHAPSLAPEDASCFDYVLIAASHMCNVEEMYGGYDMSTPDRLRDLMLDRFYYACSLEYPVPMAICHPLYPLCSGMEEEVVNGVSDSVLSDCFSLAAKKGISIEIHSCVYRDGTTRDAEGLSPTYLRVLRAAKAEGCRFHFGSDAHAPEAFCGVHALLRLAAERAGITPDDMWGLPGVD